MRHDGKIYLCGKLFMGETATGLGKKNWVSSVCPRFPSSRLSLVAQFYRACNVMAQLSVGPCFGVTGDFQDPWPSARRIVRKYELSSKNPASRLFSIAAPCRMPMKYSLKQASRTSP